MKIGDKLDFEALVEILEDKKIVCLVKADNGSVNFGGGFNSQEEVDATYPESDKIFISQKVAITLI